MQISKILQAKGREVATITPDLTIQQAAERLHQERVGALIVAVSGEVRGILSERDIVRAIAAQGATILTSAVSQIMTTNVIYASPTETVEALLERMTDRRIRHLPVMDHTGLAGIVSIGDLVKAKIALHEEEAASMRAYIAS